MTTESIRVLIADDKRVVRDGLNMRVTLINGVEVVGTACDGAEAVRLAGRTPDEIMMDLRCLASTASPPRRTCAAAVG